VERGSFTAFCSPHSGVSPGEAEMADAGNGFQIKAKRTANAKAAHSLSRRREMEDAQTKDMAVSLAKAVVTGANGTTNNN